MNVFEVQAPDRDAARAIASRLYRSIRGRHDWGRQFDPEPPEAVLDRCAQLAPREMRRAWMTAFGNARLDQRGTLEVRDLPEAGARRSPIGFTH
jgi:ATP-dependent Lon protease